MSNRMKFSTIDGPEFINLQPLDINPLMSACEIKVFYIGQNRNHSYISKDIAREMSKTLRGAPIVGWYKEAKEDFSDHGDRIVFDGDGLRSECMTKPYGFVSPDAKVWFQKFKEFDDLGNEVEREYLMTTGYLWTGQFEEARDVIENGRPHSMELDEENLDGKWSTNLNSNMEFFIINDAIFSKLCILGEDVEPCFEGSSITAPEVSKNFSKTLFSMMQELKFALQEGGTSMEKMINNTVDSKEGTIAEPSEKFSADKGKPEKEFTEENQKTTEEVKSESEVDTSFVKKEEEDKKDQEGNGGSSDSSDSNDNTDDSSSDNKDEEDDKKKPTKNSLDTEAEITGQEEDMNTKYTELENKYSELETQYSQLKEDYQSLIEFKNQIDNEKKDALIKGFYMLSDEDKKDVIENKSKYSFDEIEAKLSIIYTKKQFALETQKETQEQEIPTQVVTYNLKEEEMTDSVPDWIKAVRETEIKLHS